ncbi:MAG: hypothetical protein ACK4LB_13215, partial [Spirosomataceae bacterium]
SEGRYGSTIRRFAVRRLDGSTIRFEPSFGSPKPPIFSEAFFIFPIAPDCSSEGRYGSTIRRFAVRRLDGSTIRFEHSFGSRIKKETKNGLFFRLKPIQFRLDEDF